MEIVEELYVSAFCRKPTAVERERALKYLEAKDNQPQALEDVLWAILNTREFLFQH